MTTRRFLAAFTTLLLPLTVFAQTTRVTQGLGAAAGKAGYGSAAPKLAEVVGAIVVWVLGISGIVFVSLLVWSGVQYLISQGDADRVKKAKDTMVNAVVGIVIIIASYAVVSFIFGRLGQLTGLATQ